MTFEEARAQFPVVERFAYLNAGTNGPLARGTVEAMVAQEQADLESGRGGAEYFERALALREQVREQLAAAVGVPVETLSLATSTTNGCNIVLAGLGLGPDDEVVTTDGEHFGLLGALAASPARVRVAEVRELPPEESLEVLLGEVTQKTRLLALSHVCWVSGNRFPVEELRRATGLPLLVDGAQSVGAIPFDATQFDYYAFSCQKWLCGPDPLGGLYVADVDALRVALPTYFSLQSIEADGDYVPKDGALRFDSGWLAVPSLAGLVAALDCVPDWRFERAAEMAARCRERLVEAGLNVRTEAGQATLVTFEPRGGTTEEAAARAYEAGVVVRFLPNTPWIRASCGWWTSDEDLERLVAAVA